MTPLLLIATADGLAICERAGSEWKERTRALKDQEVTSLAARSGSILAGTPDGLFRSGDGGQTWSEASGLTARHVRWLAFDSNGAAFAGTEPANIFASSDGGKTWSERPDVAALRDKHRWSLPYSSEAGCIRGFAFHGARCYAAAEVGGVPVSDDGGETWRLAEGSDGQPRFGAPRKSFVHPDVHSIETHPSTPDLVIAPTGGGLYRSTDGGAMWMCLYDCYCRAAWIDPDASDHMIFGPAESVDSNGRIEESRDGGRRWTPASTGLKVPWRNHMVERFAQVGDELLAVLSNGELIAAPLASLDWRRVMPDVDDVAAVGMIHFDSH